MEREKLNLCKYCSSCNIKKDDYRINKRGKLQSFKCLECMHEFTPNFGFKKTRVEPPNYRCYADVFYRYVS